MNDENHRLHCSTLRLAYMRNTSRAVVQSELTQYFNETGSWLDRYHLETISSFLCWRVHFHTESGRRDMYLLAVFPHESGKYFPSSESFQDPSQKYGLAILHWCLPRELTKSQYFDRCQFFLCIYIRRLRKKRWNISMFLRTDFARSKVT